MGILSVLLTDPPEAGAAYPSGNGFPRSGYIARQVIFWEKIFYNYPTTTSLIHDAHSPENIIDIIDFRLYARQRKLSQLPGPKQREKIVMAYLKRYRLALKRFQENGKRALRFGAIEGRIFSVYRKKASELRRLFRGKVQLRSQGGLADEFILAAKRAQDFLPFMEDSFRRQGVPVAITRLAFVESMFNLRARSRVGASGIWQFMPGTAKRFLKINRLVDERNSPYKATVAAARLLSNNFRSLKAWPLAITAYNHGAAGMKRASRRLGTKSLNKIIRGYRSPSFRFASRNFYAEFLAAHNIYDRIMEKGLVKVRKTRPDLISVKLKKPLSVKQIVRKLPVTKKELMFLNSCLRKAAVTRYASYRLPREFELFLPKKLMRSTRLALITKKGRHVAN